MLDEPKFLFKLFSRFKIGVTSREHAKQFKKYGLNASYLPMVYPKPQKNYQDAILRLGIGEVVSVVGAVPYLESLKYIQNADVLLVVDAPSQGPSVFLPLKLIEYVGFKKPILGLTPPEGASASLIKRLGGIVVPPDDTAGIEEGILTFYQKFKDGNLSDYSYCDDDIKPYDAINTTRTLAELFDSVC